MTLQCQVNQSRALCEVVGEGLPPSDPPLGEP